MSIRFAIHATCDEQPDDPIRIDAHHIASDQSWFEHPIRSYALRDGHQINLLAHVALGFVLHKGNRERLLLCIEHEDPIATMGLELIESAEPDEHPDVLPGAVPLDEAGAGIEAVEMERLVIPPGGNATVTLTRATHLRIREIPMGEVRSDG